jgi:hypothetical protein
MVVSVLLCSLGDSDVVAGSLRRHFWWLREFIVMIEGDVRIASNDRNGSRSRHDGAIGAAVYRIDSLSVSSQLAIVAIPLLDIVDGVPQVHREDQGKS